MDGRGANPTFRELHAGYLPNIKKPDGLDHPAFCFCSFAAFRLDYPQM
jgi:hypothetical protein